ncbi:MAG: hypothetical protein ACFCU7_06495 [Pleurocapsa sp.]
MILAKFRHKYPQGSLLSELIKIDRGTYIVKVLVEVNQIILATALAGADTVEAAEDAARQRAIATLFLDDHSVNNGVIEATPSSKPAADLSPPEVKSFPAAFIESKSINNRNTVNFSKAHFEQSAQDGMAALDVTATNHLPESTPSKLNIGLNTESEVDDPTQSLHLTSNLFGETFTSEITEESTLSGINNVPESNFEANSATSTAEIEVMDFNEIKQQTDIEIKRLGWTKDQGKEFLKSRYGKRSRLHLTDEQLLEFLRYLEKLPNPVE